MDLRELKWVSDKRVKELAKLNVRSVEDLVKLFPRTYLDLTRCVPLLSAYHNDMILTRCSVTNVEVVYGRKGYVRASCVQEGCSFTAIWFNQMYIKDKLVPGEYYLYGRVQRKYDLVGSMVNPTFERAEENERLKGIAPVYPLTVGLYQSTIRTFVSEAFERVILNSAIPDDIIKKHCLDPLDGAYAKVHFPKTLDDIKKGSERIAIEEFFILISALRIIKGDKKEKNPRTYSATAKDVKRFAERFPFEFTDGQKNAVNEIYKDMRSGFRMNRLIQGDVGSGKTAVALTAVYMAVKSGYQAVMLSPTEVLASQSAQVMKTYFPEYRVAYMSGSTKASEKKEMKKALKAGEIDILCGTHAVIQKDVEFQSLALVVCDEQHRFGVAQRSALSDKGEMCDVIVMSATPIPRTLSLIFYGDLDITTIKDKPVGRQEIATFVVGPEKYDDMIKYVVREAKKGHQSYFVCPKIDEDEEGTLKSVTELYSELKEKMTGIRLALLHGRMSDKDKNAVMNAFKGGEYDCLVSTTVIEVGIDVPSATIMVIHNAERFGLAQLHQLRGRVGRGADKSYCFLLMGVENPDAKKRLEILRNTTDGFEIAESDMRMRGSGDLIGTRQSGRQLTELRNLQFSIEAVYTAKELVDETFSGDHDLSSLKAVAKKKYASLKDVVMN